MTLDAPSPRAFRQIRQIEWLATVALWAASSVVLAQSPPSAGSQLRQIRPVPESPAPAPSIELPATSVGHGAGAEGGETQRFTVRRLSVSGASRYAENDLIAVTQFQPGQALTLLELNRMAARITDLYRRDGYLLARAHLPAQEIKDGVVTIAVLEGQLGQIRVRNTARFSTAVAASMLKGLNSGDVMAIDAIESRLLPLSDLPGLQVRSTLLPGASPGLSDLLVDLSPGARWSGSVDADNAGSRYTGPTRVGGLINLNNPLGLGDVASLRGLTSGEGLGYVRGAYQVPVAQGRMGVAYSHLAYRLGREFDPLDARGSARVATWFGSHPLVRSRRLNVNLGLALDAKVFHDRIDSVRVTTEKWARTASLSVYGDVRDTLFGLGGTSSYSLAWTGGSIDIRTPMASANDAATARTNGRYSKLAFNVSRVQVLSDSVSLSASASGQWASKTLDASERMELGGMYGVRAYPEGEAYADQGYLVTVELRKQLSGFHAFFPGDLQVLAFADGGRVTVNKRPWTPGTNHRGLAGVGLGVVWSGGHDFAVRAYWAHKLGDEPALSAPDTPGRLWIQSIKYF